MSDAHRHRIILASSSPSRLSVLRSAGVEPSILVPGVDEDAATAELHSRIAEPTPAQVVCHLAQTKSQAVLDQYSDRLDSGLGSGLDSGLDSGTVVIAADSMLLLDGELQGKPLTVERTVERWRQQRGATATLITGHAVTYRGTTVTGSSETVVHFAEASDRDIEAYAATGEPLQCAGAFTLEALGGWFIDRIEGDPSSVIGLSLPLVRRTLAGFGLDVSNFWNR
ncbi:Maf family protein [Corynebacterium glyciniphilum]|uniref:Nucleoside triphosphate pyrophosphatase n=1 Tax=Corynebacterium glyciniphilum AJ 3170 TaxID=1404245 RepID=X5DRR2_9CORY|nr:nucleoside triphosphate pyrophosphatase [Corynebacterium glyciniphilum]AHW63327.1 Maf-like protein [Corynebacterium glyciniphilum AJ 3170]